MKAHPLVSVIVPVYNREKTLKRALDSVLEQSYAKLEVIIVDDCSSDKSVEIVEAYDDSRIHLIRLADNHGAAYARNIGIANAHGDCIAFQDSDDVWLADKLKLQIEYMLDRGFEVAFSPYVQYCEVKTTLIPDPKRFPYVDMENSINHILSKTNVIGTPTLVLDRRVIDLVGGFDTGLRKLEDYELMIRISKEFKIGFVPQPLLNAYIQNNSISVREDEALALKQILEKHQDYLDAITTVDKLNAYGYFSEGDHINSERVSEIDKITENECMDYLLDYYHFRTMRLLAIQNAQCEAFVNSLENDTFAIYGAGKIGRRVFEKVKKLGKVPSYFVVSEKCSADEMINDIPVTSITNIKDKDLRIIVAVGDNYKAEIMDKLKSLGFNSFICYPQ